MGLSIGDWLRSAADNDERYGYDSPDNPNNRRDGVKARDSREDWEHGADAAHGGRSS